MAFIRGEAREQTTMFPVTLDELIPEDHMCRVVEGFVERLDMAKLGFVRAELADRGRPGYDPRDLLKLISTGICSRCGRGGGWRQSANVT
jgi:transposase